MQVHVDDDIAFWREHNGCSDAVTETWEDGEVSCTGWTDCEGGSEVQLCTHERGHSFPEDWEQRMLGWLPRFTR